MELGGLWSLVVYAVGHWQLFWMQIGLGVCMLVVEAGNTLFACLWVDLEGLELLVLPVTLHVRAGLPDGRLLPGGGQQKRGQGSRVKSQGGKGQ